MDIYRLVSYIIIQGYKAAGLQTQNSRMNWQSLPKFVPDRWSVYRINLANNAFDNIGLFNVETLFLQRFSAKRYLHGL